MSRKTKGQCPNPTSRDTSGAQSAETMRLSGCRRSEASKHRPYEARHPCTHNALRHRSADVSNLEVAVGVAPRWCVAQSGAAVAWFAAPRAWTSAQLQRRHSVDGSAKEVQIVMISPSPVFLAQRRQMETPEERSRHRTDRNR